MRAVQAATPCGSSAVRAQHAEGAERGDRFVGGAGLRGLDDRAAGGDGLVADRVERGLGLGVGCVDWDPGHVVGLGLEDRHHLVGIAAADRFGEEGDAAAEAVDAVEDDDAVSDAGAACAVAHRRAGRRRADDVAEHGAGLDRGELAGVADEDEAGVGADGLDEAGHQRQRDH